MAEGARSGPHADPGRFLLVEDAQAGGLTRIGQRLFPQRGWIPVPLVLMMLSAPPRHWGPGLVILALGEAVRLWAVGHIGRVSRTRGEGVGPLIDVGPYSRLRNPLYVGNILIFAGVGVVMWPWVAVGVPLLVIYYAAIVRWEEANLRHLIGQPYIDYCARVPRWLPGGAPKAGVWSLREALRSERGTFVVLTIVLSAMVARGALDG